MLKYSKFVWWTYSQKVHLTAREDGYKMRRWKRFLGLLISFVMIFSMFPLMNINVMAMVEPNVKTITSDIDIWDGTVGTCFHSGTGTQSDPYVISNGQELAYLSYDISQGNGLKYSDSYFVLCADIYLNDISASDWYTADECKQWVPIGSFKQWGNSTFGYGPDQKYEFTGNFDGCGYTIYGLFINGSEDCCGLFGSAENAQILNLKVANSYIAGNDCVGSVIANSHWGNQIINCESDAIIKGKDNIGGIAGRDRTGTYQYNCFKGKIEGENRVGGIVGDMYYGFDIVTSCYNAGQITGISYVGGIAGSVQNNDTQGSRIENCYNEGVIRATGNYVYLGGITGHLGAVRSISRCYNIGNVVADNNIGRIGGIVGNREVRTGFSYCYYLDTTAKNDIGEGGWFSPNTSNRKTEADLKTIGVSWAKDYPSIWYTDLKSSGYIYPQLVFPETKKYAKLLVCDADTGEEITDYKIKLDEESGLIYFRQSEVIAGNYIVASEASYQRQSNILITREGYEPFSCNSNDLARGPSMVSASTNKIFMTPVGTHVDEEQQTRNSFIVEHVEFAKDIHDTNVLLKGFQNVYWKFDDGDEFSASTLGNWMGNVDKVLNGKLDDISFSWDYYEMYLADLIISMVNREEADSLDVSVFSDYSSMLSKISGNWVAKFKYIDENKESLLSESDSETWNVLTENVDWSQLGMQIEEYITNQEYELDSATRNFLLFVTGEQFFYKYQDTLSEVFEGLNIASEAADCICGAADTVNGFRKASQTYVAARTAKNIYEEFFAVLSKVIDEVKKEDFYKGQILQEALKKYEAAANNDAILFAECIKELSSGVVTFSYDLFVKSYIQNVSYTLIGNVLNIPAGTIKLLAMSYNLGYAIGDGVTGISDKSENYTLMYYIAPVEKAMETVAGQYKDELIKEYDTYSSIGDVLTVSEILYRDAQNYDCSYRVLRATNEYLYNCLHKIGASGLSIDIGDLHIGQASEIVDYSAGFLCFWKQNMCHGNAITISNKYKITSIQCPVDVYVYSETDELLASIVDENVEKISPEITILLHNGKKTLIYSKNDLYKLKIVAREEGVMDYYVSEVNDGTIRNIEYYGLPISKGQKYEGELVSQFEAPKEAYALHTDMNSVLPDYDDAEEDLCLDTPAGLSWEGNVALWNQVTGAAEYRVFVYKNTEPFAELVSTENKLDLDKYIIDEGEYSFAVVAVGNEAKRDSKRSEVSRVYRFSAAKAPQTAPAAPEVYSKTSTSVTLKTIGTNSNGASAEYSKDGGITWQRSPIFTELTADTSYNFIARYVETDNFDASPASAALLVTTDSTASGSSTGGNTPIPSNPPTGDAVIPSLPDDPAAFDFTDVSSDSWYYEAVQYVVKHGLMNGYGNGKFGPNDDMTRGQFAQIIYNKTGKPAVAKDSGFIDVVNSDWYYDAVTWAADNKFVSGYGNGRFGPDDAVTREQLAVMLWRYEGEPETSGNLSQFADGSKIGDYAVNAFKWAVENGIVNGKGSDVLDPKGKATRAEVATMLMRYCENVQKRNLSL